jgi:hypothetical protein
MNNSSLLLQQYMSNKVDKSLTSVNNNRSTDVHQWHNHHYTSSHVSYHSLATQCLHQNTYVNGTTPYQSYPSGAKPLTRFTRTPTVVFINNSAHEYNNSNEQQHPPRHNSAATTTTMARGRGTHHHHHQPYDHQRRGRHDGDSDNN